MDYGRPSLALDLEEEFRPPLVDALVLRLVEQRAFSRADFAPPPDDPTACYLQEAARARLVTAYEARLRERVSHGAPEARQTWRRVIRMQVEQLARTIGGEQARYQALVWNGTD